MAQIGTIRLRTQNNGTVSVPVFDVGDSGSSVYEMVRVQTPSGVGFIPVVDPADASFPYLRVQTQNYGVCAVHNESSLFTAGERFYASDDGSGNIYQYVCSTPYDVSTASQSGSLSTSVDSGGGVAISKDGTRLLTTVRQNAGQVREYSLSTPYDITTGSFEAVEENFYFPSGILFDDTGSKMFLNENETIYQYSLSTNYTLTDGYTQDTSTGASGGRDIAWNADGTRMYLVNGSNAVIYQYDTDPFDITNTFSYVSSGSIDNGIELGICVEDDGTSFNISGSLGEFQTYDASTPFDASTISENTNQTRNDPNTTHGLSWNLEPYQL